MSPMQRPLGRLLRTNAFRLAALYLALFATSVSALLAFIYFSTADFVERQTEATVDAEITGLREQYDEHGIDGLKKIIVERAAVRERRSDEPLYLLADESYQPIAGNLSLWPDATTLKPSWISFPLQVHHRNGTIELHQALGETIELPDDRDHLLVGRDVSNANLFRTSILETLGWASLLTIMLGVLGGLFMTRNMLRRVDAVNRTSERIIHGDMSQRVALTGSGDEFDQLATNLNAMLDQIERLMAGMRQVTDNIAHDLRTPLARLRARLEVTLLEKPDAQRYGEALRQTIAEADTLLGTFNALLSIAEA
ncbi:MAG: HAMP domain-containing protein, partial [Stellaceae bacterium]